MTDLRAYRCRECGWTWVTEDCVGACPICESRHVATLNADGIERGAADERA
jgi:rubrerythrin